jgi:heat shock protein HslJ
MLRATYYGEQKESGLIHKCEGEMKNRKVFYLTMIILIAAAINLPAGCSKETDRIDKIDWVDFIKFNGITYLRTIQSLPYSEEELEYFDEIRFRVEGNVDTPDYESKDGDAAYLDEGTQIYSISGYSPDFRLVAKMGTELLLFEADTNPNAETGSDLLDIGGKVEYIGINDPVDGKTELASITEPDLVSRLVEMVLEAAVDQTVRSSGTQIFIEFHLRDGTKVNRSFWAGTGELHRGIMLPDDFWETIKPLIPAAPGLDGTQWSLIEINGKEIIEGSYISLYFRNGSVQGFAGCNTYGAGYSTEEPGILEIQMLTMTAMACYFPLGVLEQEEEYVETLSNGAHYSIIYNELEIYGPGNEKLLAFEKIPEYSMDPADLVGTSWQLVSMNGEPVLEGLSITLTFENDSEASGRAGCFDYVLHYTASGDDIGWGMTTRRDGELSRELERQALRYTDSVMWVANYRLTSDRLELYTSKGDTLVYEPLENSDGVE